MSQNSPHPFELPPERGLSWKWFRWTQRRQKALVHGPWSEARSAQRWMVVRAFAVFGFMISQIWFAGTPWSLPCALAVGLLAGAAITAAVARQRVYRDGYVDGLKEARAWVGKADEREMAHLIDGRVISLQLGSIPGKGQ